jgi:hypothetical protein
MSQQHNPANPINAPVNERTRIPMSVPVSKLSVPEIPGYRLYWFRGEPGRLARAEQAGYEFVDRGEVELTSLDLAGGAEDGNTDLGTRVTRSAGDLVGEDGQPTTLVLMKIREEWALADDQAKEDRNDTIAAALRGGMIGSEKDQPDDRDARYVGRQSKIPELFRRKSRAAPTPIR